MNATTLIKNNTKVVFHNMNATLHTYKSNGFVCEFDTKELADRTMDIEEITRELGKTLHLRSPKKESISYPCQLSISEQIKNDRMQEYINELNETLGEGAIGNVKKRQKIIERAAMRLGDIAPPSPSTLARWQKTQKMQSMGIAQIILDQRNKKRRSQYANNGTLDIALVCIDDYYLTTKQNSMSYAYEKFTKKMANELENAKIPSRVTFEKWINEICSFDKYEQRHGKREAKAFRRNAVKKIITQRPLQRVESDGLHLSIGIVDDNGHYLGRVILLFVFDTHTRCLLGYKIVVAKAESSSAIIDSYRHALMPKTVSEQCINDYPMFGVFEDNYTDGGKGYLAKNAVAFLLLAGIKQNVAQSYSGWAKPFVERFNGTVRSSFASRLDCYCGSLGDDRASELTIQQKAVLTLPEFEALFEEWLVDEYHQKLHSALACTPYEAWTAHFKNSAPMLPSNYEHLKRPAGEKRVATISGDVCHQGIQINNLRYNDAEGQLKQIGLQLKAANKPATVECQYSETNIFEVLVINPFTGEDFLVETTDPTISEGMSLVEFKAKNEIKKLRHQPNDTESGLDSRMEHANARTRHKTKDKISKKQSTAKPRDLEKSITQQSEQQQYEMSRNHIDKKQTVNEQSDIELGDEIYEEL